MLHNDNFTVHDSIKAYLVTWSMTYGIQYAALLYLSVRKPQTDIPIPISNFFREPYIPIKRTLYSN